MKQKSILRTVLTAVLTLVAASASAYDFEVDGIYYLDNGDGTASVTYKGNRFDEYLDEYTGDVVIPSSVTYSGNTYTVTNIGSDAFDRSESLTSVYIPSSVTSIGNSAFYNCPVLTRINIPSSVVSIDYHAFGYCENLKRVDITSLEAWLGIEFKNETSNPLNSFCDDPESTVTKYLYLNDVEIKDLVIPNSITTIGNYVFTGCNGLTSLTLHDAVTSIGEGAFNGCTGLTSIDLGSVSVIGMAAFYGCTGLTSVAIPSTVNTIYEYAFMESGLTRVDISSLEAWMGIMFDGEIANPLYVAKHLYLNDVEIKDLVIPNSITTILFSAFMGCSGLTSVTIPNSVTEIHPNAFKGCSGLTDVTIPSSVTEIGGDAFLECSGLINVNISSLEAWLKTYFSTYNSNPLVYAKHLYLNGVEIKDLVIPSSVTSINGHSFCGFSGLTSVNIPNSVTEIESVAFYDCHNLNTIYFNAENCVDSYSNYDVFYIDNSNLNIIIGKDVKNSPEGLFRALVKAPKRVISQSATPPAFGYSSFNSEAEGARLIVPTESVNRYMMAEGWKEFSISGIDKPITAIELSETETAIAPRGTKQLTATITPSDATIADILEWSSSDQNVAIVDANGLISAIGEGTATITAKSCDGSGVYATCTVNVRSKATNVNELVSGINVVVIALQGVRLHNGVLYACTIDESVNKSLPNLRSNVLKNTVPSEDSNIADFDQRDWVAISGLGAEFEGKELCFPFVANYADGVLTPSETITATADATTYELNTFRAENIIHGGYSNYNEGDYKAYFVPVRVNEVAKFMGFIETVGDVKYLYSDNEYGRIGGEGIKVEDCSIADNATVYSLMEGILVADKSTKAGVKIIMLKDLGEATGVETVETSAARISSANGCIIITAVEDGKAAIYDFTGRLIKNVPVVAGDNTAVSVVPGCYIVKTEAKTQSVVVK